MIRSAALVGILYIWWLRRDVMTILMTKDDPDVMDFQESHFCRINSVVLDVLSRGSEGLGLLGGFGVLTRGDAL